MHDEQDRVNDEQDRVITIADLACGANSSQIMVRPYLSDCVIAGHCVETS